MKSSEYCALPVCLLGILDDGWAGLSDSARQRLAGADVVIGAGRTLALVGSHLAPTAELIDMDGKLGQVPGWMLAARDACRTSRFRPAIPPMPANGLLARHRRMVSTS